MSRSPEAEPGPLDALAPLARDWFLARFGSFTQAQALAWPALARREHALLVAPTGSGKTLAAMLEPLGRLSLLPLERERGVRLLYLSPLRALDADIHHNLRAPLEGMAALARERGLPFEIHHAVRTGDTTPRERRELLKRPPEVLLTTPESLYVMLGSEPARALLSRVETVLVDELHAVADSKRGTHLALSLERLDALCGRRVQRVGLTATAEPLDALAKLLVGDPALRPVRVLDGRKARALELRVEALPRTPGANADPRIERAARRVLESERALLFVGSRALAERVRPALEKELAALGGEALTAGVHHGALAREVRQLVEHGLREGGLKVVVATGSLELGIDVGAIDLVLQLGCTDGVATLLQRAGRAGHSPSATSRAVMLCRGGMEAVEGAVLARLALQGKLEPVRIPREPLDVLAQQLLAEVTVAGEAGRSVDELWELARHAWPYRDLARDTVLRLLEALASDRLRAPRLQWDARRERVVAALPTKRLALTAGGAITSRGLYRMLDADSRQQLGELDEEFVHESKPGDRFSFGLGVYRVVSIRPDAVLVRRAPPGAARMPFWRGDRPLRAAATGEALGRALAELEGPLEQPGDALQRFLSERYPVDAPTARVLAEALSTQRAATPLPTHQRLVLERFDDALGERRLALHAWCGRAVLEPWALALTARLEAQLQGAVHVSVTDNGILWALPQGAALDLAGVPALVTAEELKPLLEMLVPRTALAGAAFREAAERALLLPRNAFKKRTPLWMNRQRARDLLLALGEDPAHPLLRESLREVLEDRWDTAALRALLEDLARGEVRVEVVQRRTPSPMARALETAFTAEHLYEDDTPGGERAVRAAGTLSSDGPHGTFDAPLELAGLCEPGERGLLHGLSPEWDLRLLLLRAAGPVLFEELARHLGVSEEELERRARPHAERGELAVGRFTERLAGDLRLELCDPEVLARLRRKALSRARRLVEPVPRRAWQRWLLERHGAGPFAAEGEQAFLRSLSMLSLWPVPPECFERDLLRVRAPRDAGTLLELACARGELRYVLLEAPARLVLSAGGTAEALPPPSARVSSEAAEKVREVLRARGALFLADVVLSAGLGAARGAEVLTELLRVGEVSNDAFGPVRALFTPAPARPGSGGRYALRPVGSAPSAELVAERMFERYGVIARPLCEQEPLCPAWGALRELLERKEARGELRQGEVLEGLGPVQFARTETIEALRAAKAQVAHEAVLLSSRDPALGAEVAGLGRAPGTRVVVRHGEALLVAERDGATLRTLRELDAAEASACVEALRSLARLPAWLRPFRALTVERVDEKPASSSVLTEALRAQGFESDGERMALPSFRG